MAYGEVMGLPMRVFWQLSGQVERLVADEHKKILELLTSAQSPEASKQMHEALHKLSPDPVKYSARAIVAAAKLDKEGLDSLRSLA